MGGGWVFVKIVSASLFKEDPSNEPNFGQIHLTGQYLQADILKSQCQIGLNINTMTWFILKILRSSNSVQEYKK
jgi:hypothetical protein